MTLFPLQIAETVKDIGKIRKYSWHPHSRECYCGDASPWRDTNTLYLGAERLSGIAGAEGIPGFGTFEFGDRSRPLLKLTRDGDSCMTHWRADVLPWLDWNRRRANMSYHDGDDEEMRFARDGSYFQAASRGQEFVVDRVDERTSAWLKRLFRYRKI